MKKTLRVIAVVMLIATMSFCMFSCDFIDELKDAIEEVKELEDKANKLEEEMNKNDVKDTGNPSQPTDESANKPTDNPSNTPVVNEQTAFEKAANEALKSTAMTLINSTNQKMYMKYQSQLIPIMNQLSEMGIAVNGKNSQVDMRFVNTDYMAGSTPAESVTGSMTFQIADSDGYKFYVSSLNGTTDTHIYMTATTQQVEGTNDSISQEISQIAWSVNDFKNVTETKEGNRTTYVCTVINPTRAQQYDKLCETLSAALMAEGATFNMDKDSVKYTVVIENNKFVSNKLEMEYDVIADGTELHVEYSADNTYDYEAPTITAPSYWDYDTDIEMTWEQYWAAVQQ